MWADSRIRAGGSLISGSVAFVDVPYQDMRVRNFQGGFVRPRAKWFRAPE